MRSSAGCAMPPCGSSRPQARWVQGPAPKLPARLLPLWPSPSPFPSLADTKPTATSAAGTVDPGFEAACMASVASINNALAVRPPGRAPPTPACRQPLLALAPAPHAGAA